MFVYFRHRGIGLEYFSFSRLKKALAPAPLGISELGFSRMFLKYNSRLQNAYNIDVMNE